jgi:hypothetical protein
MTAEGVVGLVAGFAAGSMALVGWALGSGIEGLASVIVVWRFTGSRTLSPTSERRAQQLVAAARRRLSRVDSGSPGGQALIWTIEPAQGRHASRFVTVFRVSPRWLCCGAVARSG